MRALWQKHNDAIQVRVPLPFPLKWVNSYLIPGKDGYTLVDPGIHTEEVEQAWQQALEQLQIHIGDIEQIVLTHHHPDHYGFAGWFQEQSGCKVWMSAAAKRQVERMWGEGQTMTSLLCELFKRHGMGDELLAQMVQHMDGFIRFVSPQPHVSTIEAGKPFRLGDIAYQTIHTPGHAFGHICFYEPERKVMFCGDHVLPQISPNVSYIPGADGNPLQSYLDSLADMRTYDVAIAYPGHREPFASFQTRAQEIIDHHAERLNAMLVMLQEPLTAYELCTRLFGTRLTVHQLRFAISETLAHVFYLHERGAVKVIDDGELVHYQTL